MIFEVVVVFVLHNISVRLVHTCLSNKMSDFLFEQDEIVKHLRLLVNIDPRLAGLIIEFSNINNYIRIYIISIFGNFKKITNQKSIISKDIVKTMVNF